MNNLISYCKVSDFNHKAPIWLRKVLWLFVFCFSTTFHPIQSLAQTLQKGGELKAPLQPKAPNAPFLELMAESGAWTSSVAFSPDDTSIATGSILNNQILVRRWSIATGNLIRDFDLRGIISGSNVLVAFSPDGRQLAVSNGGTFVGVWDATTGKLLKIWGNYGVATMGVSGTIVNSLAFSSDGKSLVAGITAPYSVIKVMNTYPPYDFSVLPTGQPYVLSSNPVTPTVISSNSLYLASGGKSVKIWNLQNARTPSVTREEVIAAMALIPEWGANGKAAGKSFSQLFTDVSKKQKNPYLKEVFLFISQDVLDKPLSDVMAKFPDVFTDRDVQIIQTGEATNGLFSAMSKLK